MYYSITIALLFALWEGIMYYDPFKKIKFLSRDYYYRTKTSFWDKYIFPIDGGHIAKFLLTLIMCYGLANGNFKLFVIFYLGFRVCFQGGLMLMKYISKRNERQSI